jgi:acyl carrier protein
MGTTVEEIREKIREHLLRVFMPGESPDALTDTTPLITGGVLSSITTLQVVTFLEDEFGVEFVAREIDLDNMDTVEGIASLVESKLE